MFHLTLPRYRKSQTKAYRRVVAACRRWFESQGLEADIRILADEGNRGWFQATLIFLSPIESLLPEFQQAFSRFVDRHT